MNVDPSAPLVIAAMPSELKHALDVTGERGRCLIGPWVRWSVMLDERPVTLLLTGIGMVNSGAALARALYELSPALIINYGCAGAHRDDIHAGDVVIGTRYVHHRAVTILPDGRERHARTPISPEDTTVVADGFDADPDLLQLAQAASVGWSPEPWSESHAASPEASVHSGPLASADSWAQSTEMIKWIHGQHGTLCEDMEAASLAQIARMHGYPFLAIKDISNNEFHAQTDHGMYGGPTLEAVEHQVGKRAFDLVRRILNQWDA